MKILVYILMFMLFSCHSFAASVESFNRVEVNPVGSTSHKVTASVHLVSDFPITSIVDKLAVRETIAIALSSLTTRELTVNGGVEATKHHIFKQIKASGLTDGGTIQNVYVTDLVVSFIGANRASVFVNPKIKE
jgi:hypothetical protein